jgi:GT2 family glycosyltransferase
MLRSFAVSMTGPGQPPLLAAGSARGRALVVIPSYGVAHLTRDVVCDVLREPTQAVVLVIDNEGDYRPVDDEVVWRPGKNLGWLRASNAGMRLALETGGASAVLLNNDTRLSDGFFAGP